MTAAGFRLSPQQEQVWSPQTRGQNSFGTFCALVMEGRVGGSEVLAVLRGGVRRHEILRTVFVRQQGMKVPFQTILEECDPRWRESDLSGRPRAEQEAELSRIFMEEKTRQTDLERGPVVAAHFVRLSEDEQVLTLALPAMCADGGSLQVLAREVEAALNGRELVGEIMQFADVTEWQHGLLESEDEQALAGKAYWQEQELGALNLPMERKTVGGFTPAAVAIAIAPEIARALAADADAEDVLLACWQMLLWRVSGQVRPVVRTLFSGRGYEEVNDSIGLFARQLPITGRFDGNFRFREVVEQIKTARSEAAEHQEYFVPRGRDGDAPVAFEFAEWEQGERAGAVKISLLQYRVCADLCKMKLVCVRTGGELRLELQYDSNRYATVAAEQMARCFATLLAAVVADPEIEVVAVPLLDDATSAQIVNAWNQTQVEFSRSATILSLFEAQVARAPQRAAVICDGEQLTYEGLNRKANQLAHHLRKLGVGANSRVGLCFERSTEMVVALLGILKAGGAYVALNADTPAGRLMHQLAGVRVLVTEEKLRAQMPAEFTGTMVSVDGDRALLEAEAEKNPEASATAEDLVYVIYTSGSTGVPKGVAVRHRNLVNYAEFVCRLLNLDKCAEGLNFATVTTIGADLGNTCIYPALISGGCLHVITYETATDSRRMAEYQEQHRVDVLKIVPSHLAALLNSEEGARVLPRRYLILGGEALSWALVEKVRAAGAACEIVNHYGPTETTVGSLTCRLSNGLGIQTESATVPIGKPIANTQAYILDGRLQPVPVGVVGELYIGGEGVTAGYLDQPELTAERFVADPFSDASAARLYRTGDLARHLEGGNIEFLGRGDDQVKVRGFRIELGEVESVLAAVPGVKQVAVVAIADEETGEKRLAAYVVLDRQNPANAESLRKYLREQLPEYMVPGSLTVLEKMPLNANGKIDRKVLPSPEEQHPQKTRYVAPRTQTEEVVANIWTEVLRRERVGAEDNFFDLGGHSLLATQVVSRVRKLLEVELPLRTIFEMPTVAQLGAKLEQLRREQAGVAAPEIRPVGRERKLPLSFAQQQLWLVQQLDPASYRYNVPRAVRMKGVLNVAVLEQSLSEICRRHEALRTLFAASDGNPVQVIAAPQPIILTVEDLTKITAGEREEAATRRALEEYKKPFDFAKGPLVRTRLMRLGEDDHMLVIVMPHIVSDGSTGGIFFDELGALYSAFEMGKPSPLAPLPVQYADYAVWERECMQGSTLEQEMSYWRAHLDGVPALLELPTDRARMQEVSDRGGVQSVSVPKEVSERLKALSRQSGATLFVTMLTALRILLYRWSGQEDFALGTVTGNRSHAEIERLIGCFLNFMPLRDRVVKEESALELLKRVRQTVMDAYAHQDCPFEKIVEAVNPERALNVNPIYNVALLMQTFPEFAFRSDSLEVRFLALHTEVAVLDLRFMATETANGIVLDCEYKTDLFDATTIRHLLQGYAWVLGEMAANPQKRVDEFALLDELVQHAETAKRRDQKQTIAVAATFTAEPLEEPLKFWMGELGIPAVTKFAPYHQVFQELLDPTSLMRTNESGFNVVLVRMEDWHRFDTEGARSRMQKIERNVEELVLALQAAGGRTRAEYILCLCPASRGLRKDMEWAEFLARMEAEIVSQLSDAVGVHVITNAQIEELYPVAEYEDEYSDKLGHVPYTTAFFSALGTIIVRRISGIRGPQYRVVVLDCDQTLWKKDGVGGVVVDASRRALQEFMLKQRDRGMLLCLASKHSEAAVWSAFEAAEMVMRRDDIVSGRLSDTQSASVKLRSLAEELRVEMEGFIFASADRVTCAEIEEGCPEVLTLELPQESEQWPMLLKHVWAFDPTKVARREKRQGGQIERREPSGKCGKSVDDLFSAAEWEIEMVPVSSGQAGLIAELADSDAEFSSAEALSTEAEVAEMLRSGRGEWWLIKLRDRFGDYGAKGAVMCGVVGESLVVEALVLSSRALGKGIEYELLARWVQMAQESGLEWVDVRFSATAKCERMKELFSGIKGAQRIAIEGSTIYRIAAGVAVERKKNMQAAGVQ